MKNLTFKLASLDKSFSDNSFTGQKTTAEKQNLVACLASMGITHLECTFIADRDANLISAGNTPSPRTMAQEIQDWINVIHAQKNVYGASVFGGYLKIVDRHVWCGVQGISGFSFDTATSVGTASSAPTDGYNTWLGREYDYFTNRGLYTLWQTGDIICPMAEITGTAFGGNFFTSQSGAIGYSNQVTTLINTLAGAAGVTVQPLSNPNFSEAASGWWSGFSTQGNIVCADYYGQRQGTFYNRPQDYVTDWKQLYLGKDSNGGGNNSAGGFNQFWMEWGDIPNTYPPQFKVIGDRLSFLKQFYEALRDNLVAPNGHLVGFSNWGGWNGQNSSLVYKTGSGASSQYFLNAWGEMLRNFYIDDGRGMPRVPVTTGNATDDHGSQTF